MRIELSHACPRGTHVRLIFCFEKESVPKPARGQQTNRAAFVGKHLSFQWHQGAHGPELLTGLGRRVSLHPLRVQRAVAAAVRRAEAEGYTRICMDWPFHKEWTADPDTYVRAIVTGAFLSAASPAPHSTRERPATGIQSFHLIAPENTSALRRPFAQALMISKTLAEVRVIANLPGNASTPDQLASKIRALTRADGIRCAIMNVARLKKERCEAILGVGRGSAHAPCLIRLDYTPVRTRKQPPVVIIGKTVTFDSGGISLKPPLHMEWMRYDKCGGMAALATILAAARLQLPIPLTVLLPVAENMPGGNALRPGDVLRTRSGQTVEIITTDAEGRLLLADAMDLAGDLAPRAIIDVATLTGAVIVALGHEAAGLMANHEGLATALSAAGERAGDRVWRLPLWPEYAEAMQTPFADLRNLGIPGKAGTILGAAFIQKFTPDNVPWAHLDIAGTAWVEAPQPYTAAGATLSGAPLLIEWLLQGAPL